MTVVSPFIADPPGFNQPLISQAVTRSFLPARLSRGQALAQAFEQAWASANALSMTDRIVAAHRPHLGLQPRHR